MPGLRREELALLAGVSASYYTRLEQGQSLHASPEVLDAIARALRLNEQERTHLHDLARGTGRHPSGRSPQRECVHPATDVLLRGVAGVPALVLGRCTDVLAWNAVGHALFAGHLDGLRPRRPTDRPNMARLVFLDAHTRDLYGDWPRKARAVVGNLRLVVGQHPDDPRLASLIGELTMKSPEFASMWADHRVKGCSIATYEMRHPLVGSLSVTQQTLLAPASPGQVLVFGTTEPGSPSESAMRLLSQLTHPGARTPAPSAPLPHAWLVR